MAGGDAAVDGAAEGRLEAAAADAGLGERRAHGVDAERGERAVGEPAEGMEADPAT